MKFENFGIPDDILEKAKKLEKFCINWDKFGHTLNGCKLEYESRETKCKFYVCKLCHFVIRILPIKGYEGYYEISDNGNIYSIDRWVKNRWGEFKRHVKRRKLIKHLSKQGYARVPLSKNDNSITGRVCRLVAQSFVPNPLNLPQVNHKDSNKQNDNWWNFEWVNNSQNQKYSYKNEFHEIMRGEKNGFAKLKEKEVRNIIEEYKSGQFVLRELAEIHNVSISSIWCIVNGKNWKHIK